MCNKSRPHVEISIRAVCRLLILPSIVRKIREKSFPRGKVLDSSTFLGIRLNV